MLCHCSSFVIKHVFVLGKLLHRFNVDFPHTLSGGSLFLLLTARCPFSHPVAAIHIPVQLRLVIYQVLETVKSDFGRKARQGDLVDLLAVSPRQNLR